ncbi:lipoate--protein ligase family protein [Lactobacillus sp. DCY120]|uniref:Lipoate--protein ligase family protein n=1 Tax=Bombilactobacillus apium TaxID=2675299 RepID=A0A850QZX0_9LACO|nr:lipoate--protein ligase family protein [Bombilactobacillus apium]NVY96339.1 lipoate--protein ligase family protein [Bombilactobacillus apium]
MSSQPLILYNHDYQNIASLDTIFPETTYLAYLVQKLQRPLVHFWQTLPTVILGLQDKRLANLPAGSQFLRQQNYQIIIRNAGGLAVVSDPGVFNWSYFLPNASEHRVDTVYQLAFNFLQKCLPELKLEHYKVEDSYCPGDFDIVVQGKKIAGLAQRRQQDAVSVMLYIALSGPQTTRGQLIKQFYQLANSDHRTVYPEVNPQSMTTVSQLFQTEFSVTQFKQRLLQVLKSSQEIKILTSQQLSESSEYDSILDREIRQQQRLNRILK